MAFRLRPAVAILLLVAAASAVHVTARQRFNKQEADRFHVKLGRIIDIGSRSGAAARAPQTTPLTDSEVNAYLRYHASSQVPVGIVEPVINALGDGRVSGHAIVDLDAVRKQRQRTLMDPLNYLTGKLPLRATGMLITQNGVGRFQLESAEISGVSIPKPLLQELLSYYSRTPENPAGISLDDPFELPARIREIRVGKGEAVVVQ